MSQLNEVLELLEQRYRIKELTRRERIEDSGLGANWFRTLMFRLDKNIAEIDVQLKALAGHKDAPEQDKPEAF